MHLYKSISIFLLFIGSSVNAQINSGSFAPKINFSTGTNGSINLATGDLDGDGKKDVVVANEAFGKISIYRNTSASGSISFAPRIDSSVSNNTGFVQLVDMDADGKPDVVVSTGITTSVAVYRNLSTPGNIILASKQVFTVGGSNAWGMWVSDLDGDAKPDIVTGNSGGNSFSILRNTSTTGSITFATATIYTNASLSSPSQVLMGDLDADTKNDLIFFNNSGNNVVIVKNITVNPGSIMFNPTAIILTANSGPHRGDIADVDGDGKLDIAASNYSSGNTSVYRNTSTPGNISFAAKSDFTAIVSTIHSSLLRDLDADGKPELVQTCGTGANSKVNIYRNFANPGAISAAVFGSILTFSADADPRGLAIEDIDSDGNPDLLTANYFSTSGFSILRSLIKPSNGLVAYYPFNGNAGDSSGFGNHGSVSGPTLTIDRLGRSNSAYSFTKDTDIISVPAHISIRPHNKLTIAAWTYSVNKPGTTWNTILSYRHTKFFSPYNSYAISTYPSSPYANKWTFLIGSSPTTQKELISKNIKPDNTWMHIAAVLDSGVMKIYINGFLDTSYNANFSAIVYNTLGLSLGNEYSGSVAGFRGTLDDIRIYNRALSLAEIRTLAGLSKIYYSKSNGNLNQLSTWGENPDGSGASPLSFDSSNVTYYVTNNASPVLGGSLKISGAGSVLKLGNGTTAFTLNIAQGDTLSCDSIFINSNITVTATGTLSTAKLASATASAVQYLSTNAQTLAAGVYNNLIVYGSQKSLSGNTIVASDLGMVSSIHTNGFGFILGTGTANKGTLSHTQGTIIGKFTRWFDNTANTGGSGLFPVGVSSKYAPFQVEFTSAPSSGGVITAEFIASNPGTAGLPVMDMNGFVFLDKAAIDGFWKVNSTINSGTFTAYITANNFTGVNDYTRLRLLKRASGGSWTISPGSVSNSTGSNTSVVVNRSGLTGLEAEYGIGGDQSQNPLPVTLLSFNAKKLNPNEAMLSWKTATELNAEKFVVQRSVDKKTWESRNETKASGHSASVLDYRTTDDISSLSGNIYYRLIQHDLNGDTYTSKIVQLNLDETAKGTSLSVYPNPAHDLLIIEGIEPGAVLFNNIGIVIQSVSGQVINTSALVPGLYYIRSGNRIVKFVKE